MTYHSYSTDPSFIEPPKARRRREEIKRMNRAVKYLKQHQFYDSLEDNELLDTARRLADNFKNCSCPICCNPRHSIMTNENERLTIQEKKAQSDFKEQIEEVIASSQ